jgi:hypothetical protein
MGSYTDNLRRRLGSRATALDKMFRYAGAPKSERRVRAYEEPEVILPSFDIVVPPHPSKYPDHPGHKGSVFGGVCNRTACSRADARWYNVHTFGYYCRSCAAGINFQPTPICFEVDHDLTHEEMNVAYRAGTV